MTNTRRSFLGGLSGVAASLAYSPLAAQTTEKLKPLMADAGGEKYWNLVVEQFPLRAGRIPMNAANLCPSRRDSPVLAHLKAKSSLLNLI